MEQDFHAAVAIYRALRARFDQRKELKGEFEVLLKFDEYTIDLWGLYQQAVVGNINVPSNYPRPCGQMVTELDYFDSAEKSWMWGWIKGLSKTDATYMYIAKVRQLERELPELLEQWRDEEDPRVPDEKAWVPEEERESRLAAIAQAKKERRERDEWKHALREMPDGQESRC